MKKPSLLFFLFALVVINLTFAPPANAQKNDKFKTSRNAIPNRYIVVLNDDVGRVNEIFNNVLSAEAVSRVTKDLTASYGGAVDMVYSSAIKGYAAEMSLQQAQTLSRDPRVKYVEEDFLVFPDDTQTNAPWGLDRIDQRSGRDGNYNYTSTGAGVHAYIIDSGIRTTHNEFTGRIGNGRDFINDGKNGEDCDGHGTHVAGITGGTTFGVAKQVTLHSLRVFPCEGAGRGSGSIGAIDWITANHIKPAVVNMSLGGSYQTSFNNALQNSIAQGITYVVSAGNDNNDACDKSPASTTNAITVGSTTINDVRSSFSNYGSCVDIFAPGSQITSAWFTDDTATRTISGTSMAAPHVTGVVALFLQANPAASPAQVENSIINSATAGVISNVGPGSPNRLLHSFVPFNASPAPAPAPSPAPAVRINESGPATPYPSSFSVSGLSGVIANTLESVRVRINGFSHSYPGEVALVLEGPTGARLLIQGKVGKDGEDANNLNYTISDSGSAQMSDSTLVSGTNYKPTALGLSTFPAPGPGTSYNNPGPVSGGAATFASTFGGTNPNGVWKLYVIDEENGDRGRIDNWSLDIATANGTPAQPPSPPTNLRAEVVSTTQINVFWNAFSESENVTSYNLRINGSTIIRGITFLSFPVTNLNAGTTYTFEVQAVNSAGAPSNWSGTISARTASNAPTAPPPSAPTNVVTNVVSTSQINVFWNAAPASENVVSYNLRVNGGTVIRGITYLSFPVTGLNPGTTYTFEVAAVNSSGVESNWSQNVSATTAGGGTPPPTPGGPSTPTNVVTDVVSTSQINVFWNASPANENVVSYNLRINGSGVIRGITYLSFPVTGLNPGTTYTFEVQAINSAGALSNWSTPINAITSGSTPAPGAPSAPTNIVTEVVSRSQINVYWNASPANENVVSYNLRVNGSSVIRGITYLSFPVTGLNSGTSYTFEVQAVNSSGVESNWSAGKSATTASNSSPEATVKSDAIASDSVTPLLLAADTAVNFIGYDSTTKGNWVSQYGRQGNLIVGDQPHLPNWAQLSITGQGFHIWAPSTGDMRALIKSNNNNDRVAAALFSPTQFEMAFNFTDGQSHRLALYSLDWEGNNRNQTFELVNAVTGVVLDTRTINNFNGGLYVVWQVKGKFTVRIKNNEDARLNSAISGVFIDNP